MGPHLITGTGELDPRSFHSEVYTAFSPQWITGKKKARQMETCVPVCRGQVASFLSQS